MLETLSRKRQARLCQFSIGPGPSHVQAASDVEYVFMPFDPSNKTVLGVSQLTEMAGELGGKLHTFGWGALGHFVVFEAPKGTLAKLQAAAPKK